MTTLETPKSRLMELIILANSYTTGPQHWTWTRAKNKCDVYFSRKNLTVPEDQLDTSFVRFTAAKGR